MSKVRITGSITKIQEIEYLFKQSSKALLYKNGQNENNQYFTKGYEIYPALDTVPREQRVTLDEAMILLVSSCFRVRFQYDYRINKAHILFGITHYDTLCKLIPNVAALFNQLRKIDTKEIQSEEYKLKEVNT